MQGMLHHVLGMSMMMIMMMVIMMIIVLFLLPFCVPVNTLRSCRARSVYVTTVFLE